MGKKQVTLTFANPMTLIVQQAPPASQTGSAYMQTTIAGITVKGTNMSYTLPDDKQVQVQVSYVDSKGHPASVDGDVQWASSDDTVCTVTADTTDSTLAMITPAANLGNVQITATADADLGAGVSNIITPVSISVVAGQAVAGTIAPTGDPQPIPGGTHARKKG